MTTKKLHNPRMTNQNSDEPESLKNLQLALQAQAVLDIPSRTRFILTLAGLSGITIIIVESMVGGTGHTVRVDKIIHFTGYAIVSIVLILGLKPLLFIPALFGLAVLGMGIEFLQVLNGRYADVADHMANMAGIGVGATIGLIIRTIYAYIKTELAEMNARNNLTHYNPGDVILREGDPIKKFYIIKKGKVQVTRKVNGTPIELTELGPGEVIGALGVIEGTPQYTTVNALSPTWVYGMDLNQLMTAAGGREQPVSTVLRALAAHLKDVIEKRTLAEAKLEGNKISEAL